MSLKDFPKDFLEYHKLRKGEAIPREEVKKFINKRNKAYEELEARIVGTVWGLAYKTNFDVEKFNNKMVEIRKKFWEKCKALAGKELI